MEVTWGRYDSRDGGGRAKQEARAESEAGASERINGLRAALSTALSAGTGRDFSFIERQRGLFSFLGISPQQVAALRDRFGIYMVDSSRVNVAGLNDANIDYFVDAAVQVMSA